MDNKKLTLEIVENLRNLADSIEAITKEKKDTKRKQKKITLEEVRAKLATLSKEGKQLEVKALIAKYGADKLSEISPEKYSDLLKEAEEI